VRRPDKERPTHHHQGPRCRACPGPAGAALGRARPRGRITCAPLPAFVTCVPSQEQCRLAGADIALLVESKLAPSVSFRAFPVDTNAESAATTASRWTSAKTATTTTSRAPRMRRRGRDPASQERNLGTVPRMSDMARCRRPLGSRGAEPKGSPNDRCRPRRAFLRRSVRQATIAAQRECVAALVGGGSDGSRLEASPWLGWKCIAAASTFATRALLVGRGYRRPAPPSVAHGKASGGNSPSLGRGRMD
jgi:hypothetical protein